ncbi:terminase large subunit domain-containing protein [Spirosoma flavum]|uniref:Terminase large subunit domain-containing protein n=1 Tax=Spirosoma flavum TaxID=2048557 RepID=A0ABW6APK4_9BACT
MSKPQIIKPQLGFQEQFMSSKADIAIGGGAAGGGKSWVLTYEATRHRANPLYSGVLFRRTYPQVMAPGGLWEKARELYPMMGAHSRDADWLFPGGSWLAFRHMQHEKNVYDWQGSELAYIGFDELTQFSEGMFWYMLSRNRSSSGVKPIMRGTCNPDPDSFVATLIEWWIDQEEKLTDGSPNPRYGFPIAERSGLLRYFTRDNDTLVWGNTMQEVIDKAPHMFTGEMVNVKPKSITFVPGDIFGNKIFLAKNPDYLGNLMALPKEDKVRLLDGNWKVRSDGMALYDPASVGSIFTNYAPGGEATFITADIARFGHDWTVVLVWKGWEVLECVVMKENDSPEAVKAIEKLRSKWRVMAHNVLVDQNGVGGSVLQLRSDYKGFLNNAAALPDPVTRVKENYKNLKTQCYYRNAERLNAGGIKVTLNNDTVVVYETSPAASGGLNHIISQGCRTKMGTKVVDVRDVIKQQLRAIRKDKIDIEGKKQINTKEAQKILLGGWSPDFADCIMMREYFELIGPRRAFGGFDNS